MNFTATGYDRRVEKNRREDGRYFQLIYLLVSFQLSFYLLAENEELKKELTESN